MSFEPGMALRSLRAAQYVRMSTDHQKYSIESQQSAIAKYAAKRNITIVRTYADEGRSGLVLLGRDGLKELIADVQLGRTDFDCVLVFDVSQWADFRMSTRVPITSLFASAPASKFTIAPKSFENDGSLASTVLKTVKRIAAADYSRQLSNRIFIAQCHMTELVVYHSNFDSLAAAG